MHTESIPDNSKADLPDLICGVCSLTINTCYKFIQQCKTNEQILNEILIKSESDDLTDIDDVDNRSTFSLDYKIEEPKLKGAICPICKKCFKDRRRLKTHFIIHNKNREKLKCHKCDSTFLYSCSLKKHIKDFHGERGRVSVPCDVCHKEIFGGLAAHKKRMHSKRIKNYPCMKCDSDFFYANNLQKHIETKHSTEPPVLQTCPDCGKKVVNVEIHKKRIHMERKFQCKDCDKTFPFESNLKHHFNSAHLKLKSKEVADKLCTVCGKNFTKSGYMYHYRTHTNEKPYGCRHCDKKFRTSGARVIHERSHTDERRHSCPHCEKKFRTKNVLISHIYIHTGERPFVCHLCSRGFTQKVALLKHMKIH